MNRTDMTLQHAGFARLEAGVASLRRLLLAVHRAWMAERARNELRQLPERTLKDIGLTRADIDRLFHS